jgi:hypothetical protein
MRRPSLVAKAICSAAAILILAAGCANQSPTSPAPSQDAAHGVYANAGS